jgi:hypothetical protein
MAGRRWKRALLMVRAASLMPAVLWFFFLGASVAAAHDCSSPLDCEQTGGYNGAIALAGGGLALGGALLGGQLGGKSNGGGPSGPCAAEEARMGQASANARIANSALQSMRSVMNTLEEQYENTRESSYWTGAIDTAMLGGSVLSKPVQSVLGMKVKQALSAKVVEAMVKGFGKELAKDLVRAAEDQNIKLEDLLKKPMESGTKKVLLEQLKENITSRKMQELLKAGVRAGDFRGATFDITRAKAYEEMRKSIADRLAGPIADSVGNMLDIYKIADGVFSGKAKLEAIRASMSQTRDHIFRLESELEDALSELDLARSALNHCHKLQATLRTPQ